MENSKDILNYFAETNTGFLHACGKEATDYLVRSLNCNPYDSVLEIGVGTGATLVKVAASYKNIKLHGVDVSERMLQKASERLYFCGLSTGIQLRLISPLAELPYEDNSFDKVYVESVIAIHGKEQIDLMIKEISRVLKPECLLYMNETIWLPGVSDAEIKRINDFCKKYFGIIQSTGSYKNQQDWRELLEDNGLNVISMSYTDDLDLSSLYGKLLLKEIRSAIFSLGGYVKGKMKTSLRRENNIYQGEMKELNPDAKKYMDGIIIIASKKK